MVSDGVKRSSRTRVNGVRYHWIECQKVSEGVSQARGLSRKGQMVSDGHRWRQAVSDSARQCQKVSGSVRHSEVFKILDVRQILG